MTAGHDDEVQSFKVFLSHRYKSADTNLHFFNLFSSAGKEVQFKVDEGAQRISMTRLERMVRDADAFLGIYPYPEAPAVRPAPADVRKASRYFRLELDLAIRSGKPAIVFSDERYHAVLPRVPYAFSYDPQELAGQGRGGWPTRARWVREFNEFCGTVETARTYQPRSPRERLREDARVGLLLPTGNVPGAYTPEHLAVVKEQLDDLGLECVQLDLPERVSPEFLLKVWQLDWAVVDVASQDSAGHIVALLHGQFLPMLRVKRVEGPDDAASPSALERTLFGGFDVGYKEDILVWHDLDSLADAIRLGFAAIYREETYIASADDARQYFSRAQKRKERVFLSYSGDDRATVAPIADAFQERFQTVYDYRQHSIPVGKNWFEELVGQVAVSPVGVPLLSRSYLKRPVCLEEAERMAVKRLQGGMSVLPINLDDTDPPPVLENIQYIRAAAFSDPASLVEHLIQQLPAEG
jgi:hypothetical protein